MNTEKLPEICLSIRPGYQTNAMLLKRGEVGYWDRGTFPTPQSAREYVDDWNTRMGVTKLQEECMLNGSLFGFDVPGADPDYMAADAEKQRTQA
jgi:hypothetical protein